MPKKITATRLRQEIYAVLDEILETGETVEIERKGRILRIVSDAPLTRLSKLKKRNITKDGDLLLGLDWSGEWKVK